MYKTILLATLALAPLSAAAEEGMWRPDQLPEIGDQLTDLGLKLDPEQLSDLTKWPMSAVISLGGCTASFVSPQGLVVTNHHCAYGTIQYNSDEENNYLADGFLAADMSGELPAAPGTRVYVTTSIEDVTDRVMDGIDADTDPRKVYQLIEDREKAIIAECEDQEGHRCQVAAFNGAEEFRLIDRLEIRDVRLVYAPPASIGKYGGDIDNWMWPRHTGDWSFYRAYVGPDGEPADYAEENVPFEPDSHLKVSAAGLTEDDFVMAAGYPGSTSRYARLSEVESAFSWRYPTVKKIYDDWIATIEEATAGDEEAAIKYASLLAGLNNASKNFAGQMEGAEKVNLEARRAAREEALNAWLSEDEARQQEYGEAIARMDALVEARQATREQDLWYNLATNAAPLSAASRLYRLARESQKPDAEREPGYQERDLTFFRQSMESMERRFDADVDKAVWLNFLEQYLALPADQQTEAFNEAMGITEETTIEDLEARLDAMYAETEITDLDRRLELMEADPAVFGASEDPFIELAVALYDYNMEQEEEEKTEAGQMLKVRPTYMEAITAWQESQGQAVYPDANSTLRVTYGTVDPACPEDGLCYTAFTTLEGIAAKHTGEEPFDSPERQLQLIEQEYYGPYELESLDSVPVNFLSTLDSTGGNSGSPTMNARGELVGLLFDGTYESINSDWLFDDTVTRTIHVDSRYMLWVMDYVDEADWLIEEMDIVGAEGEPMSPATSGEGAQ